MTFDEMKEVDVRTVNAKDLADVTKIRINPELTEEERRKKFLKEVKNPYCFLVGDVIVKSVFEKSGCSLNERFEQLVLSL